VRILFNGVEAFGLGTVLEQALGLVAFGIPHNPSAFGAPQLHNDPPAEEEPAPF
jgi:hypothetical protein